MKRLWVIEEDFYRENWNPIGGYKFKNMAVSQKKFQIQLARLCRRNSRFRIVEYTSKVQEK